MERVETRSLTNIGEFEFAMDTLNDFIYIRDEKLQYQFHAHFILLSGIKIIDSYVLGLSKNKRNILV